MLDFSNCELN